MTTKTRTKRFDVVGLNYRLVVEQQAALDKILQTVKLKCELEREPKNANDPNAIKVVLVDKRAGEEYPRDFASRRLHIGFLRRDVAKVLAPAMDAGRLVVESCKLVQVNSEHGWGRVSITFSKKPASKPKIST